MVIGGMIARGFSLMFAGNVFVFILGLLIGSFLNTVIYRVPRRESFVVTRSHCPNCGHCLKPWELVPVLSYLIQKGRCRKCGIKISLRYPAVEILTGIIFILIAMYSDWAAIPELLTGLAFASLLIALSFIDMETMRLPNSLVTGLFLLGAIKIGVFSKPGFFSAGLGAVGTAGCFLILHLIYNGGIGLGDVKLAGALGFFLGFPDIIFAVLVGSLLGTLIALLLIVTGRKGLNEPIPFGPFLAVGAFLMFLQKSYLDKLSY
ncbi:Prepilin peptidase [Syntrophobotulus glycolicus DSM 8271]|uniref:Prepilin leader peptidase/N-methyltransferase n=1 Tax=Syntrophobotulus glycolicus (strain DSM 8271 / FlGlyR) TaxID=645991 RepID=F0T0T2_SYNGF|nr:A24 family peptidase [Syntrophobotulus glycolicus]ADY56221.1 Prepilin peptidase [Syntrophobotulus glycolicus DSM 8271]